MGGFKMLENSKHTAHGNDKLFSHGGEEPGNKASLYYNYA